MSHFHVRWCNSNLDWEAFPTAEEAKMQGERLKRQGESYVVEELDGDCPICKKFGPKTMVPVQQ